MHIDTEAPGPDKLSNRSTQADDVLRRPRFVILSAQRQYGESEREQFCIRLGDREKYKVQIRVRRREEDMEMMK